MPVGFGVIGVGLFHPSIESSQLRLDLGHGNQPRHVPQAVQERSGLDFGFSGAKDFALKGFDEPTRLWAAQFPESRQMEKGDLPRCSGGFSREATVWPPFA